MKLVACGINHHTASLTLREQLSFSSEQLNTSLNELRHITSADEVMILSTCNRTEFYCINGEALHTLDWLYQTRNLSKTALHSSWYVHHREKAVQHLMRVASGLDSMILGEPQITGQLKKAFSLAQAAGAAGRQFKSLFQTIFQVSKQIRQQTALTKQSISLPAVVVSSAKQIFAELSACKVLIIGAGETSRLVAQYLLSQGIRKFYIANRSKANAEKLALQVNATAMGLDEIKHFLSNVDIIVTATASKMPVIGKDMMQEALKKRRRRPLFIADLGMPRDVADEVKQFEDIYLYSLEHLQDLIQHNQLKRHIAALEAEAIIETRLQEYKETLKIKRAAPLIRAYRQRAEKQCEKELKLARNDLIKGISSELVLQQFASRLTKKLLHHPTVALRDAASNPQREIFSIIKELLNL